MLQPVKDLQIAVRQLLKRPIFTTSAVIVLALGLGANAAIFSVVNAVLLEPLPFPHPQNLMGIFERDVVPDWPGGDLYNSVAPGSYLDWRRDSHSFSQIAATYNVSFNLSSKGQTFTPERIQAAAASANLFKTLEVSPVLGRAFLESEDQPNAPYVAVISYELWKQRFGGSTAVLHQKVRLDGNEYNIIGVAPKSFDYPNREVQAWVALNRWFPPARLQSHSSHGLLVIGRLRPGYSAAEAQAEISSFVKHYRHDHPGEVVGKSATVIRLDKYLVQDIQISLWVLLGAVGCLLIIACVNIANLLLTRALGRRREIAIRAAVGASRAQIIRQLLIESVTLALAGALAGLLLASWAAPFLAAHAPDGSDLPQVSNIQVDYRILLFTIGLSLVTGVLAGLFPAYSASQTDVVTALKEGGRSNTASHGHQRARSVLITVEVGVSVALLIAAGLLLRSFDQLRQAHTGVRAENTITMGIDLPDATYTDRAARANFARQLSEKVKHTPGVLSCGLVSYPPLAGAWSDNIFHIEGYPLPPGQMMDLITRSASPGYFQAAGIPLLEGRSFTERDSRGFDDKHPGIEPVLISESTAKAFFQNLHPIGQRIQFGTDAGSIPSGLKPNEPLPTMQVIGVVGDVLTDPASRVRPTIYGPLLDGDENDFYLLVHTSGDPETIISVLRGIIHHLDPDLPVHDVRTIQQIAAQSTADRQFSLVLLSLFAVLALGLAAVGLYGVVSYAVSQRTDEIGIRMALGADRAEIGRMILVGGLKPALAGILAGLAGAAFLTRAIQSMLFHVSTADPITYMFVPLLLLSIVVLACLIPAYRASRIDPMTALRTE